VSVTVTQLAREAKVSVSLVSRLVNHHPNLQISAKKKQQILAAADRLGGMPVGRGAQPTSRPTLTRNMVMPIAGYAGAEWHQRIATTSVTYQALKSFRRAIRDRGYRCTLTLYETDRLVEGIAESIVQQPAISDGIFLGTSLVDPRLTELLLAHRVPHVSIDMASLEQGINTVLPDERLALRKVMRMLVELGHRNIGYFGPKNYFRFGPVAGSIIDAGLPFNERNCCLIHRSPVGDVDSFLKMHEQARGTFADWLPRRGNVTAIIASSDNLAKEAR